MEENKRFQFTFYNSFYQAIQNLESKEDQADFYNAICNYALNGVEPNFTGMLKMAWELIRPNLESSRKKAEAGKKGGQNKQNESKNDNDNIQELSKIQANDKQNQANEKQNNFCLSENSSKDKIKDKDKDKDKDKVKIEEKEKKEEKSKIQANLNDFIDWQYVEDEYKKGDFDFDLVKFWTYWKDKGLRKFELSNKFITWEIKDREKKKVQNITEKLVKQMKVNNELKYRQDMEKQQENDNYI